MEHTIEGNKLTVRLAGRLDTNNAEKTEDQVRAMLAAHACNELCLDASELEYISSAGLRVVMRLLRQLDSVSVIGASPAVYDVFEMTGLTKLIDVRRAMREVSIDGLHMIGAGANGRVFRLDEERIVKVYNPLTNPPEKIAREKRVARQAFVHGVPSALSFEMVRVAGEDFEGFGIVYEMIDAMTLGEAIVHEPGRLEEYAVRMARLLRELHATRFAPGELPDARLSLHAWVDVAQNSGCYSAEVISAAHRLADSIPPRDTFVHGDFHPGNIMVTEDDELLLIDIGDASVGDPVVDLLGSYQIMRLVADQPGGAERYTGLSSEQSIRVWDTFVREYHGTDDPARIEAIEQRLKYYVVLRSLPGVTFSELVPVERRNHYVKLLSNVLLKGMPSMGDQKG